MQTAFIALLPKAEEACTIDKTALWVKNNLLAKEIFFLGSLYEDADCSGAAILC
jgi:hypothetical protein